MPLAPWGNRQSPLLPLWYRDTLSGLQLPDEITKRNRAIRPVADIGAFWESTQLPLDRATLQALVELVCREERS